MGHNALVYVDSLAGCVVVEDKDDLQSSTSSKENSKKEIQKQQKNDYFAFKDKAKKDEDQKDKSFFGFSLAQEIQERMEEWREKGEGNAIWIGPKKIYRKFKGNFQRKLSKKSFKE
jgi:phosphate-selective porin